MYETIIVPLCMLAVVCWSFYFLCNYLFGTIIIYDHETGLLYNKGRFRKKLESGKHFYFKPNTLCFREDNRLRTTTAAGQEILTKDNINIKISLVMTWSLQDFLKARNMSQDYFGDLYTQFQMAIRQAVEGYELDALLEKRDAATNKTLEIIRPYAAELGIEVKSVGVRDIILPATLKKAYSGALEARKDSEREIEKARGEQAVLRKLANLAKMIPENPGLLQLRTLQAFSKSENITVFLGDNLPVSSIKNLI